ncbi:MAG: winged helix-turn-helix domain-containing protein [Alphaproteobacteria bacterium]
MSANSNLNKTPIYFHGFRFVLETEELFKGKKVIPLQPLAGKLLALLIRNPNRLLTREVIQNHLWPETLVDYDTRINALVKDVRKALGDTQGAPKFIETIPKKGYRFKAATNNGNGLGSTHFIPFNKPALIGALLVIAALFFFAMDFFQSKEQPVLLILPVQSLSSDPAIPFLADNLTNQLIAKTSLAGQGSLAVIARTSAMKFKNSDLTAGEMARVFGADYVLEVSLSQTPDRVMVTSALIDPKTDQQIWSNAFEKPNDDLYALDQEIVGAVMTRLDIPKTKKIAASPARYIPSEAAYKAYLEGLYLINQPDEAEKQKSLEFFKEAISHDPGFALAHYQIARLFRLLDRPWEEIIQSNERALTLDDNLADAYYLRAFYHLFDKWDWPAAEADFLKALEIEPTRARFRVGYSYFLGTLGRSAEARKIAEKTFLIDPFSPVVNSDLGWIYLRLEDYGEAILQADRLLEISPQNRNAFEILLVAYRAKNDIKNAGNVALRILENEGASEDLVTTLRALSGEEQISAMFEWRLGFNPPPLEDGNYNSFIALSYAGLGEVDMALDFFEKALQNKENFMVNFMVDPRLNPLRAHPRYLEIVEKIGRPVDAGLVQK